MKKALVLMSAMFLLTFTSCKKENTQTTAGTAAANGAVAANTSAPGSADIPDFDDPKLDEYAKKYTEMINIYKDAITSNDMSKMQQMQTKASELASQSTTFTNISAEDRQKLEDFSTRKMKEIQELVGKAAGQ